MRPATAMVMRRSRNLRTSAGPSMGSLRNLGKNPDGGCRWVFPAGSATCATPAGPPIVGARYVAAYRKSICMAPWRVAWLDYTVNSSGMEEPGRQRVVNLDSGCAARRHARLRQSQRSRPPLLPARARRCLRPAAAGSSPRAWPSPRQTARPPSRSARRGEEVRGRPPPWHAPPPLAWKDRRKGTSLPLLTASTSATSSGFSGFATNTCR